MKTSSSGAPRPRRPVASRSSATRPRIRTSAAPSAVAGRSAATTAKSPGWCRDWRDPLERPVDARGPAGPPGKVVGRRKQFIASFDRLCDEDGGLLARCTADELALHLTINLSEAHVIDDAVSFAAVRHLPDHGSSDEDFNWMREVLFEDHELLMLFNPALDGVENDINGNPSLHPRRWFTPFR